MGTLRKPLQGVTNIVRFNWHFFALALLACFILASISTFLKGQYAHLTYVLLALSLSGLIVPLVISCYIYDFSSMYELGWLDELNLNRPILVVNVHAGFDETSILLKLKYPEATLKVLDFYDPQKHTEISIKRAKKAYPAFPGTLAVRTSSLPLKSQQVDCFLLMFAAHEIRDEHERIAFFKELERALKIDGKIVVVEHIRDSINFLAYNIGFLHFHSKTTWQKTFYSANLTVSAEEYLTPFIKKFVLSKNGNAA